MKTTLNYYKLGKLQESTVFNTKKTALTRKNEILNAFTPRQKVIDNIQVILM